MELSFIKMLCALRFVSADAGDYFARKGEIVTVDDIWVDEGNARGLIKAGYAEAYEPYTGDLETATLDDEAETTSKPAKTTKRKTTKRKSSRKKKEATENESND